MPTIAKVSGKRPPAPTPWTARKITSSHMFCAVPQSAEPRRKIRIAMMKRGVRGGSGRFPTGDENRHLPAREDDSGRDQQSARDLVARERLMQEHEREERAEERLKVCVDGCARRPDPVDRVEPEEVRQEERHQDGERECQPNDTRQAGVVLRGELR